MPIVTKGLEFPILLSSGKHVITNGDDLIKSSIKTILKFDIISIGD